MDLRDPHDDRAVAQVRLALLAADVGDPAGRPSPSAQLRARVTEVVAAVNEAGAERAGQLLPSLIGDLHATLRAGWDTTAVRRLLTLAHTQGTQAWLAMVGAPADLAWHAAMLSRRAAEELDEPAPLGISAYGGALGLLAAGAFDLAAHRLAGVRLGGSTVDLTLSGSLALAAALVATAHGDADTRAGSLEQAAELASRTGETNLMGFGFGPSNVAVWRMQCALEAGDPASAVRLAATVDPEALPVRARQAVYWRDYGRALALLPRRREAAITMLTRAERISPEHVRRHPLTVSAVTQLRAGARQDRAGREIRALAHRAGIPG